MTLVSDTPPVSLGGSVEYVEQSRLEIFVERERRIFLSVVHLVII